jgi:starch-binding outer membrane protein, SusD/RagB family
MKKIKFLIYSIFLSTTIFSCSDDILDRTQDGEINNDVAFQTVTDLRNFLDGNVYSNLENSSQIAFTASFTDECGIGPNNGGQELQLHRFNLNSADGYVATIWLQNYSLINRANRLLEAASKITPVGTDVAIYNGILAETRALRAFAYLNLQSYYSTDMSNPNALGVILLDYVPKINEKLSRATNAAIHTLMESDLAFARANITGTNYKFVTRNMIDATAARMYLYRKNYPLAKQFAQDVLTNSGGVLTIATPVPTATPANPVGSLAWHNALNGATTTNPYRRLWVDFAGTPGQGEIVFALSRPVIGGGGANIGSSFVFNTSQLTGGSFLKMGMKLFDILNETNGDIRVYNATDPTSTSTVKIIDKYPGKGTTPLRNDLKIFRLSEMRLIIAEAEIFANQLPVAAGHIKVIRDARNFIGAQFLPVYSSQQQAYADLLKERRKEFCFEGHRYLDLKRLGVVANVSIDRSVDDDIIPSLPLTISNTDYRFTMPIPQDEIAGNPQLASQQNPGY